jgi:glycosyltransferase involved in cell wall biosynthesis
MKVVQMTSVHSRFDVRIHLKECRSLAAAGHEVTLLVADGEGPALAEGGVRIVDVGLRQKRRIRRAVLTGAAMWRAARRLRADVYHMHDPELLPWGVLLRLEGRTVIYDAHEHLADDILSKPYLSPGMMRVLVATVSPGELAMAGMMSAVVAATPAILARFAGHARNPVGVYNFPLAHELARAGDWSKREGRACYVGGISISRGIRQIAAAATHCRTQIVLAGPLWDGLTEQSLAATPGWDRLCYVGPLSRRQVGELMGAARLGIVTFLPTPYHVESLPNKLFEYMSAGIPVVASNFPLWKSIVEETGSGICVDPLDPQAIAAAIDRLAGDDEYAARCGRNGMASVAREYNWARQAEKLLDLYRRLAPGQAS